MDSKVLKVLVHASAFFAPFLVPIIVYLVIDDKEVKSLSLQALLFQLLLGVAGVIAAVLVIFLVGFILVPIVAILGAIIPIIGIVKAVQDESWHYPIVGRWV